MLKRVILQVPMTKDLKEKAESVSVDMGFSSLQEAIRVILTKFSKKQLSLHIEESEEVTYLSPAAERLYRKAEVDIKTGRNVTKTKSTEQLLRLLHS